MVLAQQPWASAANLAKRLDVSESDIHKACHELEENKKLIVGRDLGVTRRMQRRYVLTRQGVMHVTRTFQHKDQVRAALPLTWQMTEDGVTRMLLWISMIESLYEILPAFWTSGLARPFQWQSMHRDPSCSSYVWLGQPTLTEVRWLPRAAHANPVGDTGSSFRHRLTPQAQSSLSSRQGGRRAGAIPGALEYPRCRRCRRRGGCWPGARLLTLHLPKRWPWGGKGQSRPGPAASHSTPSLTAPVRH